MAASSMNKLPLIAVLLFASSLFFHDALAELVCDDLPNDLCAFAISSSGKRCLLETFAKDDGGVVYQCRSSEVIVERMAEYIETEDCVSSCGVDRKSVGISSDSLLEAQFTNKLCSKACYEKCPNIVDLYMNLAAGEGVSLPDLCEAQRLNPHRAMVELMSNGAAPGPVSTESLSFLDASPVSAPSPL